jgi:predicted peptidase
MAELRTLRALLLALIKGCRVDTARLYLTGLSMGGFGSWQLAEAYPRAFAAIAPVCGGALEEWGFPERIAAIKHVPVWAFHGAKDERVPVSMSQKLVDVLQRAGGDVRLTVYPEADHDSWTQTYENPKLYEWFLKHRNGQFAL